MKESLMAFTKNTAGHLHQISFNHISLVLRRHTGKKIAKHKNYLIVRGLQSPGLSILHFSLTLKKITLK